MTLQYFCDILKSSTDNLYLFYTIGAGVMKVFEKIQKYLDENNISLSELSHKTDISEEHLSNIFSGREILDLSDFRTICLALNVMPEIFM